LDDGGGEIGLESFISGLMRMQGPALSRDMLKSARRLAGSAINFHEEKDSLREGGVETLDRVEGDLDLMHEDFTKMQMLIKKNIEQLNSIGVRRIIRVTRQELPKIKTPSLADAQKMEREAARALNELAEAAGKRKGRSRGASREGSPTARQGSQQSSRGGSRGSSPVGSPTGRQWGQDSEGLFMKPLPVPWVVRRQLEDKERRKQEALERASKKKNPWTSKKKEEESKEEEQETPGVHRQFQHLWKEYSLEVPDVSTSTLEQIAYGGNAIATSPPGSPPSGRSTPARRPMSSPPAGQVGPPLIERPPAEPWPTWVQGMSSLLVKPAPPHRLPPIAEAPEPPAPHSLPAMLADLDLRELPQHPHAPADGAS